MQSVILFAYRRPELTESAIKRILEWNNLDRLIVSVDGLREDRKERESIWRLDTIRRSELLAQSNSKIDLYIWDKNQGSGMHGIRAMRKAFNFSESIISLEEDNLITPDGLNFLTNQISGSANPLIASAYTKMKHNQYLDGVRHTNFPEQWGISLNQAFFEILERVVTNRKVKIKPIRNLYYETFSRNRIYAESLSQYWYHHYANIMSHPDYGDGIISYAAVSAGIRYITPWTSYVTDLGHLDSRGINPRTNSEEVRAHDLEIKLVRGQQICLMCEVALSQMKGYGLRPIIGGYSFRARSKLGLLPS